jgi:hypothetical protein
VAPHPPHRRHVASPRTAPNWPAAVSGPDAGCRSFAGCTSVTAVTSPLPGAVAPADGHSSLTGSETAGGSVLSYLTSAHPRALIAAEVQSSKSRNPVHARAHVRNLPGRDHTPNPLGRQALRRAEQDVTPIGQRWRSCRAAADPLRLGTTQVRPLRQLPPQVQADLAPAGQPSGRPEFEEQAAASFATERS